MFVLYMHLDACLSFPLGADEVDLFVSSDGPDSGSFAKLFVGSVPKTATEDDVSQLMLVIF